MVQPLDAGYPRRLHAVAFTKALYVRGALSEAPAVAIVGARAATRIGMDRAHAIARHCGLAGHQVISGGALGIDGAAHRGALEGGGHTTVVLGSGVDVLYPTRHASLFEEVVARGGALASLLPDGTGPRRHTFLMRNPLIAALADVTVVVEASVRSGSLATAEAARKIGRLVAAWPGSRGCDRLIERGAALVESYDDVAAALRGAPRYPVPRDLDPTERRIADAIAHGYTTIDAIVSHTGLSVRTVVRAIARNS